MGLFSFLQRQPGAVTTSAGAETAQAVDAARTRARRRLIGAVLLLGIGVIAFPLLFETQPRPIPVDIPIEIPRKEGSPPLAVPAPRSTASVAAMAPKPAPPAEVSKPAPAVVITESKADAGRDVTPPVVEAPAKVAAKPEPVAKAAAPSAPPPATVEAKPVAEAPGRFVVQVGAFADAGVARDARAKVDKLGLHTYTQTIDTDNGKRIRVRLGPFVSRDEADKAAAKVKAAGLPAAVLTL